MHTDWMYEYIGIKYVEDGRDPGAGLDCYGLVRHVIERGLGIHLDAHLAAKPLSWRHCGGTLLPVNTKLQRYDVLFFSEPKNLHIAIVVGDGNLIHASGPMKQVVCEPVIRAKPLLKAVVRFYAD